MTREERLKFCSICQKRQMDMQRGLVCSLTNEYATLMKNVRISKLTKLQSQKNSRSRGNTRKNCKKQEGF